MVHVAAIDATNIHPFHQAQIALNVQKVPVIIPDKDLDYTNVFSDSATELPGPTGALMLFIRKKNDNLQLYVNY